MGARESTDAGFDADQRGYEDGDRDRQDGGIDGWGAVAAIEGRWGVGWLWCRWSTLEGALRRV